MNVKIVFDDWRRRTESASRLTPSQVLGCHFVQDGRYFVAFSYEASTTRSEMTAENGSLVKLHIITNQKFNIEKTN